MEVRKFRETDTDAVIALFRHTVRTVNLLDYTWEQVRAWAPDRIDRDLWQGSLSSDFAVVAEEDGRLLGFGDIDDCGYLDRLFVAADSLRRGVARAIYEKLEGYARVIGVLEITAEVSITAKPFFLAMGFVERREQQKQHNGCLFTNYVMAKQL